MALHLAVLMDSIAGIRIGKDSTFAMLLEAQRRGHRLEYVTQAGLSVRDGRAFGLLSPLSVRDDKAGWFTLGEPRPVPLGELDLVLARKDPPFDADFLHDTLVLALAERDGACVVNRPQALRDANEKLYAQHFADVCPPTLVARDAASLRAFVDEVGEAVLKPLDGMGGRGIFRTFKGDPNLVVIIETLTDEGRHLAMAQKYVREITAGDKRILLIDGEPVPYALARIPQGLDFRGNMARGGKAVAQPLSDRDREIAARVAPELVRQGMTFVGLDVIGDFLTEINVTSPTGIRELDAQCGLNIASTLFDALEARCAAARETR